LARDKVQWQRTEDAEQELSKTTAVGLRTPDPLNPRTLRKSGERELLFRWQAEFIALKLNQWLLALLRGLWKAGISAGNRLLMAIEVGDKQIYEN